MESNQLGSEGSETTASGVRSWLEVDNEGMLNEDEDERACEEKEEQLVLGTDFF